MTSAALSNRSVARPAALVALAALLSAGGCRLSGYYMDRPENPVEGVHRVAVAPLSVPAPLDPIQAADALASELIQFPGIESTVRPARVQEVLEEHEMVLTDESSVRTLGRILGVDAVLLAAVTEYSPYHPPRIGLVAQLFITRSERTGDRNVIRISRIGHPQPVTKLDARNVVQIERIYDAAQREVRDMANWYGKTHDFSKEAVDGADRVLWVPQLFFRFVSDRLVCDLFEEYTVKLAQIQENTT